MITINGDDGEDWTGNEKKLSDPALPGDDETTTTLTTTTENLYGINMVISNYI